MKVLILGASGMLGNAMMRVFAQDPAHEVWGTARSPSVRQFFSAELRERILVGIDVENQDTLTRLFAELRPAVVVNCIGLVKQVENSDDPLLALAVNSMLPHRLARLCKLVDARLVHISTDCVFKGAKGDYRESDPSDAEDLYGKSKFLGEVAYPGTVTLRTSIIGRELASAHGLIDWFLAQKGRVKGYRRAVFSGLPTVELARIVRDTVLPHQELSGLYHVSSAPIDKLSLLRLVADVYGKSIDIVPDDAVAIDRSLNADLFAEATGYMSPAWQNLVRSMHDFK
jgi:dTDP-4-dehydrorhamnose reductase